MDAEPTFKGTLYSIYIQPLESTEMVKDFLRQLIAMFLYVIVEAKP